MSASVLVCDDECHVSRIVAMKLDRAGFDVQTASNPEIAWQLLQRAAPSLVILDYRMPGIDEVPFLEQLREDVLFADLPVIILLPAEVELGDELYRLRDLGVSAILRKPFSARRLVQLAREVTERVPAVA
jgi:CheY-like chemotaxis protein